MSKSDGVTNVSAPLASVDGEARSRWVRFESGLSRKLFSRVAGAFNLSQLARQRIKMIYFMGGYLPLFSLPGMTFGQRVGLLLRFVRIDWSVIHGHLPSDVTRVAMAIAQRRARPGEVVVEAGCWKGGSSAKFSLLCAHYGYRLQVYDSFQGVETLQGEDARKEWNFSGQYASPESTLWDHLKRFGRPEVCSSHKGWFSDTLAAHPVKEPVRVAYIDCDLAKGTREALTGVVPTLTSDGHIFSQDFHITPVRQMLLSQDTWTSLGVGMPHIVPEGVYLARLSWAPGSR